MGGGGGQGRGRTGDLPLFRRTLVPTELPGRAAEGCPLANVRRPGRRGQQCSGRSSPPSHADGRQPVADRSVGGGLNAVVRIKRATVCSGSVADRPAPPSRRVASRRVAQSDVTTSS